MSRLLLLDAVIILVHSLNVLLAKNAGILNSNLKGN